jgi:hypothetical protein
MAKHSKFRIVQAVIMNSLLVIIIALMIASLFSILLFKDDAPTVSPSSLEPQRVWSQHVPRIRGVRPHQASRMAAGRVTRSLLKEGSPNR